MVQMVREGAETGYLPNSSDFMNEFEVSRRTVARHPQSGRPTAASGRTVVESLPFES